MKRYVLTGLLASLIGVTSITYAQSASDQLAEYRRMLADGNPSELYEAEGEELWTKPAGPKKASLEKCDLGLGPGVVKGASAQLPRYFKDTDRVQDLESRLMTCMSTLQGIPEADIVKGSFGKGVRKDLEAVVAYIVTQSKDMKVNVPATHPKEKEMLALVEKIYYLQWRPMDFS
jgi:sulfur-oxidizing protein SoxA